MSAHIVINGKSVAKSSLEKDASGSNYILIQTTGDPLDNAQKQKLKDLGVKIQEFVGDEEGSQLYLCGYKQDSLDTIRDLDFVDYANVYVNDFVVPANTVPPPGSQAAETTQQDAVDVDVLLHHDVKVPASELIRQIANAAKVETSAITVEQGTLRLKVDPNNLDSIAAIDEVRVIHPVKTRKLFNNMARMILNADNVKLNATVYRGEGQIVAVADTGLDKGSETDVHEAFTGRVIKVIPLGRPPRGTTPGKADDPAGHGTHVCGSVLGSGTSVSEGQIEGTAPDAKLIVQSVLSKVDAKGEGELGGIPRNLVELFDQAYKLDARVHTNSWGTPFDGDSGIQNPYDGGAEGIDRFVWNNQDMTILFAAGNDGQDKSPNGVLDGKINERSLGAEVSAKNCITVGATENLRPNLKSAIQGVPYTYGGFWPDSFPKNPLKDDLMADNKEGLAAFSSRGPTAENRLKPDVVAPGTAILSTRSRNIVNTADIGDFGTLSDNKYFYLAGTSMATPLVAGCCAVIRETLVKNGYKDVTNGVKNPTGSLIKALLINGAVPIHGQYMPKEVGEEPNPHSGFGRVNLAGSISLPGDKSAGYGIGTISNPQLPFEISVPVPQGSVLAHQAPNGQSNGATSPGGLTLKVTLVYADLAGARLSNDLNLVIVAGNKERHGNQLNAEFAVGSSESFDRRNNVEQVVWANVPGDQVKIVIKGWRLTSDRVPFAYAWKFF